MGAAALAPGEAVGADRGLEARGGAMQNVTDASILVVDDDDGNVALLSSLLEVSDFTNIRSTTRSSEAVSLCVETRPDLILLDLNMPPPDGIELMGMLRPWTHGAVRVPVVALTGDDSGDLKRRALAAGASDFLRKPFDPSEVVLRIRNLLEARRLELQLLDQNRALDRQVRERTRELEHARVELLDRLGFAGELRDDSTGEHPRRVGRTAALIAAELGLDDETVDLYRRAAPLHDIGKLAISDAILLKRGKLTPAEFEVMKLHTGIGAELLSGSRSRVLQLAEEIALTHHERWDGTGYPEGLRGERIPLAGRVVAVADVFDAITHERRYERAWSVEEGSAEIRRASGTQFDPRVVDAFCALDRALLLVGDEDAPGTGLAP